MTSKGRLKVCFHIIRRCFCLFSWRSLFEVLSPLSKWGFRSSMVIPGPGSWNRYVGPPTNTCVAHAEQLEGKSSIRSFLKKSGLGCQGKLKETWWVFYYPHPLQNGIGGGVTPGIPFMVPFSLLWGRVRKCNWGAPHPLR